MKIKQTFLTISRILVIGCVIASVMSSCAMFKKTESIDLKSEARTTDQLIDDSQLERSIEKTLKNTSEKFDQSNISVLSSNGWILLVGEVPEASMILQAETITNEVPGVVAVHNYIKVDENRTLLESAHDNWIKLKVRNHLGIDPKFPSQKITVHTEKGIVYLMGQISSEHVSKADANAREVKGVQDVIKVFEVIE
ncbi:BON domain-containing protein [Marinicellulosiphila megalodicopiae]|uniref:BON domain-containing protein n=1 Tax=Marinicellulosiphila megalodicopiae TaxID=2724896 RepID=UPI003BB0016E